MNAAVVKTYVTASSVICSYVAVLVTMSLFPTQPWVYVAGAVSPVIGYAVDRCINNEPMLSIYTPLSFTLLLVLTDHKNAAALTFIGHVLAMVFATLVAND